MQRVCSSVVRLVWEAQLSVDFGAILTGSPGVRAVSPGSGLRGEPRSQVVTAARAFHLLPLVHTRGSLSQGSRPRSNYRSSTSHHIRVCCRPVNYFDIRPN